MKLHTVPWFLCIRQPWVGYRCKHNFTARDLLPPVRKDIINRSFPTFPPTALFICDLYLVRRLPVFSFSAVFVIHSFFLIYLFRLKLSLSTSCPSTLSNNIWVTPYFSNFGNKRFKTWEMNHNFTDGVIMNGTWARCAVYKNFVSTLAVNQLFVN